MKRIGFQWRCAQPNDQQINHGTRGAEPPSAPRRGRKNTVEARGLLYQGRTEGGTFGILSCEREVWRLIVAK